jgi:CheY-like chemotaxis protein
MASDPVRLLVVENNAVSAQIDLAVLSPSFRVTTVCGGKEAILRIDQGDVFELALISLNLPDMDSLDLASQIRAKSDGRTQVIGVTPQPQPRLYGRWAEWAALGASRCLTRPLTAEAIAGFRADAPAPTAEIRKTAQFAQFAALCRPELEDVSHRLQQAMRAMDMDSLSRCAHEILGYCGLLDLPGVAATCRTVEEAVDVGLHATAVKTATMLADQIAQVLAAMDDFLSSVTDDKMGDSPHSHPAEELAGFTGFETDATSR